MGVTVNYTKGSGRAHLNKRLSKQQLAERRERQLLAEHKKEEAVKRAVRTTLGIRPLSPSSNIITVLSGKPWAFNHARRDTGDRRMVTTRLPEVPVAGDTAPLSPRKLQRKKEMLLSTTDWLGLGKDPVAKGHPSTHGTNVSTHKATSKLTGLKGIASPSGPVSSYTALQLQDTSAKSHAAEAAFIVKAEEQDSSRTDIYMSSSPLRVSSAIPSTAKSTISSFSAEAQPLSNGALSETIKSGPDTNDIASSYQMSGVPLNTPPSASQRAELDSHRCEGTSDCGSIVESTSEDAVTAGLHCLPSPYKNMRHISEVSNLPIVFNFYLPCMLGDCKPPFVYDLSTYRSNDYLGMAFAGPDMDV